MTTTPAIATSGLTRTFTTKKQTVEAVKGLDLHVRAGELVAFLGPNGAGKSTTLRMLTTLLAPTSGAALVAGHDVVSEGRAVRRHIGYVGQGNGAGQQQRGRDELISQGRSFGMSKADAVAKADELIADFDLEGAADRVVSTLSGGQRRRLDVALGLINTPQVLFLDEPSTGLDPQNRSNLQEQIRRLHAEQGTTIVLTTHYLEEAEALAERVVVIDHGEVIADDAPAQLKSGLGDLIRLSFDSVATAKAAAARVASAHSEARIAFVGERLDVRLAQGRLHTPALLRDLHDSALGVHGVEVIGSTLDDVFLDLTGRSLRDAAAAAPATTDATLEGAAA